MYILGERKHFEFSTHCQVDCRNSRGRQTVPERAQLWSRDPLEYIWNIAMWAPASLFRRFTDTKLHGTGCVKIWKTRRKISLDIAYGYFLQCMLCMYFMF